MSNLNNHSCSSHQSPSTTLLYGQTLDELSFEKTIQYFCLTNNEIKLNNLINKQSDQTEVNNLVNSFDKDGFTSLHYAAKQGNIKICEILIKNGARVDDQTRGLKTTALHRAALDKNENMIKFLLAHKAQLDIIDDLNRTSRKILQTNNLEHLII